MPYKVNYLPYSEYFIQKKIPILNQVAEKVFTSHQLGIKRKYLKDTLNSDQWLLDLSFGNITL